MYSNDKYWNVWIDTSYARGVPPQYVIDGYFELEFIILGENFKHHRFKVFMEWEKKNWNQPKIEIVDC